MNENPIQAWLARVAAECGSPAAMLAAAASVKHINTCMLIVDYARSWQRTIDARNRA